MKVVKSNKENGKKITMKAIIIQPILISCFQGITISNLVSTISMVMPIHSDLIKKYLFYMIEYNLLIYNGRKQLFTTSRDGVNLLLQIELMKATEKLDTSQIFLQVNDQIINNRY